MSAAQEAEAHHLMELVRAAQAERNEATARAEALQAELFHTRLKMQKTVEAVKRDATAVAVEEAVREHFQSLRSLDAAVGQISDDKAMLMSLRSSLMSLRAASSEYVEERKDCGLEVATGSSQGGTSAAAKADQVACTAFEVMHLSEMAMFLELEESGPVSPSAELETEGALLHFPTAPKRESSSATAGELNISSATSVDDQVEASHDGTSSRSVGVTEAIPDDPVSPVRQGWI